MALDILKLLHLRRDKPQQVNDHPASSSFASSTDRSHAQQSLRAVSQIDRSSDRSSAQKPVVDKRRIDTSVFTEMFNSRNPKALELGSRGPQVVELKKLLNGARACLQGKLDISSDVYDAQTAAAVAKFQRTHSLSRDLKVHNKPGLGVDGAAGLWTVTALLSKNGVQFSPKQAAVLLARFDKSIGEKWHEVEQKQTKSAAQETRSAKPSRETNSLASASQKGHSSERVETRPVQGRQISFREAIRLKPSPEMLGIAACVEKNALTISSYACQQYVRYGLESQNLHFHGKNPPRAIDAPNRLARDSRFMEVVGVDPQQLDKLPKGAIVYYAMPGDRKDALFNPKEAKLPGHAQVSLGNGYFGSDFKHGGNVFNVPIQEVRVFIPANNQQQQLIANRSNTAVNKRSISS